MTDETEDPAIHYVAETGEGSLLEQTREMVEERSRSRLEPIGGVLGALETPIMRLSPDGNVGVINHDSFDAYRAHPLYRAGTAHLGDLDSLIGYVNRFKGSSSAVFADDDRKNPSILAVFDYHDAGGPENGGQKFGRSGATHALPLSDQWTAWASLNSEGITMPNFARFLEDHIVDVMPVGLIELSDAQNKFVNALGGPSRIADPAKLLELAMGLRVYEDSQVSQAVNLNSGEGELTMISTHTDGQGGKLIVPSMFVIAIPVFKHGEAYQILVRLRYRKAGGITFIYELWRDDLVFDHAFDEAVQRVATETSLPTYRGQPSTSF